MQKTSTTQYIVLGVFVVFIIVGVLLFSTFSGKGNGAADKPTITIWGSLPADSISQAAEKLNSVTPGTVNISYKQVPLDSFSTTLTEAVAEGSGPDVILVPQNYILQNTKLITPIPYSLVDQRTYQDTFVTAGNVFLTASSSYALPFMIDPLVLYWNKDIFASAGFPTPPSKWRDLATETPALSSVSTDKVVSQSGVSFGTYDNVKNAKEIVSILALQAAGSVSTSPTTQTSQSGQQNQNLFDSAALESAVTFYTQFANPSSASYSWNASLPDSDQMFLRGKAAIYVGFASELNSLELQNPNLNFDVAMLPQAKDSTTNMTFANVYGLAILTSSKYQQDAFTTIKTLVGSDYQTALTALTNLPSVRNDQLSTVEDNAIAEIFRRSALIGHAWADSDPDSTAGYFKDMIDAVDSGSASVSDSVRTFNLRLEQLSQ